MPHGSEPYPKYYPHGISPPRHAAYLFILNNQYQATKAIIDYLNHEFERVGLLLMSRKKGEKNVGSTAPTKATWSGFANVKLSEADKLAIKQNPYDEHDFWEALSKVLLTGHKVSLSWDAKANSVVCSFTGAFENSPNAGLSLTSTGKDIITAINVSLYKHFDKTNGTWGNAEDDDDDGMS